jgi:large subunit ribosomal protein L33
LLNVDWINQQSAINNQQFKGSSMRDIIALACTECKRRNYSTTKNKKKTSERLELSKYCRFCRKHIAHRETK